MTAACGLHASRTRPVAAGPSECIPPAEVAAVQAHDPQTEQPFARRAARPEGERQVALTPGLDDRFEAAGADILGQVDRQRVRRLAVH